jgi:hypothetical protein
MVVRNIIPSLVITVLFGISQNYAQTQQMGVKPEIHLSDTTLEKALIKARDYTSIKIADEITQRALKGMSGYLYKEQPGANNHLIETVIFVGKWKYTIWVSGPGLKNGPYEYMYNRLTIIARPKTTSYKDPYGIDFYDDGPNDKIEGGIIDNSYRSVAPATGIFGQDFSTEKDPEAGRWFQGLYKEVLGTVFQGFFGGPISATPKLNALYQHYTKSEK